MKKGGSPSVIQKNLANALSEEGVVVDYFMVERGGLRGYLSFIISLKRYLTTKPEYDIIHAHYAFTAIATSFVTRKKLVVSLMGSDVEAKGYYLPVIRFFNRFFWRACIVKSEAMKKHLGKTHTQVIPGGVDFNRFRPISKEEAQQRLGFEPTKRHILFAGDPGRAVKNYPLAEAAIKLLHDSNILLHYLIDIPFDIMVYHYNAADLVLLTSLREGSPNVIKEALACNRPVVATKAGDVHEIIRGVDGAFVSEFDAKALSEKIKSAMQYDHSNGREKIQHLSNSVIVKRILNVYIDIIENVKK